MHADNVANSLADGKVFELVSKEDDADVVEDACAVHAIRGVDNLERRQVLLRLEGLMGECGI